MMDHHHKVTPKQLLVILPKLFQDFKQLPIINDRHDMACCALPSMQTFFLNPFNEAISPQRVHICVKLQQFLSECDHTLMESYLKQISQSLACIFKMQWRDQYGYRNDANSELHILKNRNTHSEDYG